MKQLYILLFILTSSNVFAQKIPWKTDLKLSPGTKYVHILDSYNDRNEEYSFDKEGKLQKHISITYLQTFRSQFFYEDTLLIRRDDFYDDKLFHIIKYDYDGGNLVLEAEIDVEENLIQRQKSYCYLNGKLSSKLVVEKGRIDITEIKYNDRDSMSETKEYDDDQLMGVITEIVDNDTVILEKYDFWHNKRVLLDRKKYVYDKNKNIIEYSYKYDYGKDFYGLHKYSYVGNILTNAKYYDENGLLWMENFYDSKGNIMKEVRPEVGWQKSESTLFENYYNKRGDLIKTKRVLNGRLRIVKYDIKYW